MQAIAYFSELKLYYEEFNCILESIFNTDVNVSDKNCIQLVKLSEGAVLADENRTNKYFFVLIEGSCNVRKFFKSDKR